LKFRVLNAGRLYIDVIFFKEYFQGLKM